jgi:hypothetical protein
VSLVEHFRDSRIAVISKTALAVLLVSSLVLGRVALHSFVQASTPHVHVKSVAPHAKRQCLDKAVSVPEVQASEYLFLPPALSPLLIATTTPDLATVSGYPHQSRPPPSSITFFET